VYVAQKISELKNINLDEVGDKTTKNFYKIFNL
jgi:Tat protein secretion system quality control protein TatD with DNase activity